MFSLLSIIPLFRGAIADITYHPPMLPGARNFPTFNRDAFLNPPQLMPPPPSFNIEDFLADREQPIQHTGSPRDARTPGNTIGLISNA